MRTSVSRIPIKVYKQGLLAKTETDCKEDLTFNDKMVEHLKGSIISSTLSP